MNSRLEIVLYVQYSFKNSIKSLVWTKYSKDSLMTFNQTCIYFKNRWNSRHFKKKQAINVLFIIFTEVVASYYTGRHAGIVIRDKMHFIIRKNVFMYILASWQIDSINILFRNKTYIVDIIFSSIYTRKHVSLTNCPDSYNYARDNNITWYTLRRHINKNSTQKKWMKLKTKLVKI